MKDDHIGFRTPSTKDEPPFKIPLTEHPEALTPRVTPKARPDPRIAALLRMVVGASDMEVVVNLNQIMIASERLGSFAIMSATDLHMVYISPVEEEQVALLG